MTPPSTTHPAWPQPDPSLPSAPVDADGVGDAAGARVAGAAVSLPDGRADGSPVAPADGGEAGPDGDGPAVDAGGAVGVGVAGSPGGTGVGAGVGGGVGGDGGAVAAGVLEGDGVPCPGLDDGAGVGVGASTTVTTRPIAGSGSEPEASARKIRSHVPAGSMVLVCHVPLVSSPATSDIGSGEPPSPTTSTEAESAGRASGSLT